MDVNKNQVLKICKKLNQDFVSYKFLSRGNHNESYFIKTKQDKLVLRIENNTQFKNLKKEYKFLKMTDGKFGPTVFLFDNSHKIIHNDYIVEEFIDGKHPERKVNAKFVSSMALWYKRLHSIKSTKTPRGGKGKFSLYSEFKSYFRKYKKVKSEFVNKDFFDELEELFKGMDRLFKRHDKLFARQKHFSLTHGDPTRTNVFYTGGEVKLVDWEFVQFDLREIELVFFIYSYDLSRKQKELFLKIYGYPSSRVGRLKLNVIHVLHYLGMLVWRLQRLKLFYENRLDSRQHYSNEKVIVEGVEEDMKKMRILLDSFK